MAKNGDGGGANIYKDLGAEGSSVVMQLEMHADAAVEDKEKGNKGGKDDKKGKGKKKGGGKK